MEDKKQLLKSLSSANTSSKKAAVTIPGAEAIKKLLKKTSAKQVVDVVLFASGIFLMYKFGKSAADTLDNQMPTEKSMLDMVKSMQGGPGMGPQPF